MNEKHLSATDGSSFPKSLDERFAGHPQVYQRLQEIADQMEGAVSQGHPGDQVEEMTIEQLQKLGADILGDWAQARAVESLQEARRQHPEAIADGKKNSAGRRPSAR
jgi:hypothetical protein